MRLGSQAFQGSINLSGKLLRGRQRGVLGDCGVSRGAVIFPSLCVHVWVRRRIIITHAVRERSFGDAFSGERRSRER